VTAARWHRWIGAAVVASMGLAWSSGSAAPGAAAARGSDPPLVGWQQQAQLTPSDPHVTKAGTSVAIDGSTAVVGAPGSVEGDQPGAAYVFVRTKGVWSEQAELSIGGNDDQFGVSVAIDGSTIVVGADFSAAGFAGAAYVFVRANGVWSQQAELTASDGAVSDFFGVSVDLAGPMAVVGALGHDSTGAAYVFERSNGRWSQQAELGASDRVQDDWFGASVGLSGRTVLVGAPLKGPNDVGAAYVFRRSNGEWTQQAELPASNVDGNSQFGSSVSIGRSTAIVGAPGNDTPAAPPGAAYVFGRSGDRWFEQATLTAADVRADNRFGTSVAIDGTTAIVGAPLAPTHPDHNGAMYVFVSSGEVWVQEAKRRSSPSFIGEAFGWSVALDHVTAVAGAPYCCPPGNGTGAAFVFVGP
jgi:FG-GAP repeat